MSSEVLYGKFSFILIDCDVCALAVQSHSKIMSKNPFEIRDRSVRKPSRRRAPNAAASSHRLELSFIALQTLFTAIIRPASWLLYQSGRSDRRRELMRGYWLSFGWLVNWELVRKRTGASSRQRGSIIIQPTSQAKIAESEERGCLHSDWDERISTTKTWGNLRRQLWHQSNHYSRLLELREKIPWVSYSLLCS